MKMIKNVVFDVYGTLYDVFSVTEKCEYIYPGKGDQISKLWRNKQLEYTWLRTLMNCYDNFWNITKDALCYALDSLALEYDANKINDIMKSYLNLAPYAEVAEDLQKFKPRKLAVLTNGNTEMIDKLIVTTGLDSFFHGILSADSIHLFKPRPEIYQLAVDFFETSKNEILFVSSNAWDVAGAKSFGFTVGWINRFNQQPEKLGVQADYIVTDLLELAKKIEYQ